MRPRIRAHEILLYRICSVGRSTFPLTDLRKTFEAKRKNFMTVAMFVSVAWLLFAAPLGYLHAQDLPYKGKTVRVIVGFPSGGGSDAEGRVLARHLGKYIPGNPTLIVQNMPGAGGLTASNWFEELAKPDGLTLYYCVGSTAVTQQAFGIEGVKYNLRGWEMLGSVDRATSVVLLRPDKLGATDQ
jgi:tripartite-type tricarboxylate transporter receptor subunit TctC